MTVRARVIPCLDVHAGRVVKGVNFVDLRDAGDPVEQARAYDAAGADELTFLDIGASHEGRDTIIDVVRRTADPVEIAAALAPLGVRYEQWPVRADVPFDADSETVFAAYGPEIERLNAEEGFTTVDVLGLHPSDDPEFPVKAKAAREKFLQEHTHDDDDEVRFFVSGSAPLSKGRSPAGRRESQPSCRRG